MEQKNLISPINISRCQEINLDNKFISHFLRGEEQGNVQSQHNLQIMISNDSFKLKELFTKLLFGDDVNLIYFNSMLRISALDDIFIIFRIYNTCLNECINGIYYDIAKLLEKCSTPNVIFRNINNIISQLFGNIRIINNILLEYDQIIQLNYKSVLQQSKCSIVSNYISALNIMSLLKHIVFGGTILELLDNNIGDNVHNLTLIAQLIEHIYNVIEPDMRKIYVLQLKNTQLLFQNNIGRISSEVCSSLITLFNINSSFIQMYRVHFSNRILEHSDIGALDKELKALDMLTPHNDIDNKCIRKMYAQLNDINLSQELTTIFTNKINVHVQTKLYQNIQIDLHICKFNIIDHYDWDLSEFPSDIHLSSEIEVYITIFKKIYGIEHNHNELYLDSKRSTGIINIVINDNSYNFLVTLQQMNVLLQILNNSSMTFAELQKNTALSENNLTVVLNSLYSCELLNSQDDLYFINEEFFYTETNISLLNALEYEEFFDEFLVVRIINIIKTETIKSIHDIFESYTSHYGIVNYNMIISVIKYLCKKKIINCEKVPTLNTQYIDQMVMDVLNS